MVGALESALAEKHLDTKFKEKKIGSFKGH